MGIKSLKPETTVKAIEGKNQFTTLVMNERKAFIDAPGPIVFTSGHGSRHPQGLISMLPALCGFVAEMASSWKNPREILSLMVLMLVFMLRECCSLFLALSGPCYKQGCFFYVCILHICLSVLQCITGTQY